MRDLRGRTAVITGAASGIGLAMAQQLANHGMSLLLGDIDEAALAEATRELERASHRVIGVTTDVAEPNAMESLADLAWSRFGAVHLLHNNAGVGWAGAVWEATEQDWAWVLEVNLGGVINGIRSFLPRMLDSGENCHVVNTSSMAGLAAPPGLGLYATSKHAIVGLSEALAHDLQEAGAAIGVTVVCPGVVVTDIANAERHRPLRFANPTFARQAAPRVASAVDPDDPSLGVLVPLSAEDVASMTVEAIRDDRFLVLTHQPASEHLLRTHLNALLA